MGKHSIINGVPRSQYDEINAIRVKRMLALRNGGHTNRSIGNVFGVSYERVRQLIGNTGRDFRKNRTVNIIRSLSNEEREGLSIVDFADYNACPGIWRRELARFRHAPKVSCSISKGQIGEKMVSKKLFSLGIDNELMPLQHWFDILIKPSNKTVDVKTAFVPQIRLGGVSDTWCFNLDHYPKANVPDFYVLLIYPLEQYLVVPSAEKHPKQMAFCLNSRRPGMFKWGRFLNNFSLLR